MSLLSLLNWFFEVKRLCQRIKHRFVVFVQTNSNTDIIQVICTERHMIMVDDKNRRWWWLQRDASREIKLQRVQNVRNIASLHEKTCHMKMSHESMISSENIALIGASLQSFSEQRYSFLAANLGVYEKSLRNTCLGTYILRISDD